MLPEIGDDKLLKGHCENDDWQGVSRQIEDVYGIGHDEPKDAVEVLEGQRLGPWSVDGKHQLGGEASVEPIVDQEIPPEIKSITSRVLRVNLGDHTTPGFAFTLPNTREARKTHSVKRKAA